MIDILKAREAFKEYIKNYDINNGKIQLKVAHIQRVARISKELATKLNLNEEDIKLAELIGMLHDIGRFEQAKQYNTFVDKNSINHGQYGVKILFEDGLIRNFIENDKYDKIIYQAIINHNTTSVPNGLTPEEELHSKIVRDADKTDIYYALTTENIQDIYCTDDMSNDLIKDEIMKEFKENHHINYKIIDTAAEAMVSHICYAFDFNYKYGLEIVKRNDYIDKLANKYRFNNIDTYNKIQECAKIANEFIEKTLK